jgi:hypothetical protein
LIDRPRSLRVIGVIDEAAREYLIAVPRRIEEVDRLASRNAVPGRADVERDVIARDDVRGLANLVLGVQRKRVRVSRRVFQILVPDAPTPERCVEAYHIHRTRLELIAERKFRLRLLTYKRGVPKQSPKLLQ